MTEQNEISTFESEAKRLEVEASWLGDDYRPQLLVLIAYGRILDNADGDLPRLELAEYARIHRWLLNKRGKTAAGDEPDAADGLLDMFLANPGAAWHPSVNETP